MTRQVHRDLSRRLQRTLRAARAERLSVPAAPALSLYLINQDFSHAALSREEMLAVMEEPAYWAFCWASGQVLARRLLAEPERVAGKRVLDFGAGSGVAAIAAARVGAAEVIACDLDPDALAACAANADLNGVTLTLLDNIFDVAGEVDVILAADVLYDRANLGWLSRFLQKAPEVLLAESRLPHFEAPGYQFIGEDESATVPDLDQFDEYRRVRVYQGRR